MRNILFGKDFFIPKLSLTSQHLKGAKIQLGSIYESVNDTR